MVGVDLGSAAAALRTAVAAAARLRSMPGEAGRPSGAPGPPLAWPGEAGR